MILAETDELLLTELLVGFNDEFVPEDVSQFKLQNTGHEHLRPILEKLQDIKTERYERAPMHMQWRINRDCW